MKRLCSYAVLTLCLLGLILITGCNQSKAPTASEEILGESAELSVQKLSGPCVPAPDGLVSWWPGDGNAIDIIRGNDGTLVGDATFATGKVDLGFSFDGVDDYVEVPHNASLNLSEFSVDAWIFIDPAQNTNANEANFIVSKSDFSSAGGGFALLHDDRKVAGELARTTNTLRFSQIGGPGIFSEAFLTDALPSADFYHVTGTFDGSVARLYLNGVLVATGSPIGSVSFNTLSLRIGAAHAKEVFGIDARFKGIVDEVEIYNRALSASEIQDIFNAGSAGKCKEVTICHKPGTPAERTLMIPVQALDAHLAHGDILGSCN